MEKPDVQYQTTSPRKLLKPHMQSDMESRNDIAITARQRLNPQPTDDPNDPLNWPLWLKCAILLQVSLLAAIGGLNTAAINPAYSKLGADLGVSKITASYQTTVCIALNGISPWLWIPLANKYGRRPIYLGTTLLGFGSILGCAYVDTFGQLVAARVFNGFFPVAFALGPATVVDLFFYHQRGRAIGFFTITMVNGSHLAPIVGGLVGQYLGWRWIFKFVAIVDAVMFLVAFFCLPETLYVRKNGVVHNSQHGGKGIADIAPEAPVQAKLTWRSYLARLKLISHHPELRLRANQFVIPSLKMAKYPSVIFPALYFSTMYGYSSILPAVTVASIFEEFFHWDTLVIGLAYGGALTIGGCLGELSAGWVLDLIVKRERARLGRDPEPEVRLRAIWLGEFCTTAGLLIYGFTLQYHTMWFGPIFGMGFACYGLQIITATTYTYSIDCYRTEGSETSQLFNFINHEFGFTFAFYVVRMGSKIGYQFTFLFFALCGGLLAFIPMIALIWKGAEWRHKLGNPVNVNVFDQQLKATDRVDQKEDVAKG